MRIIVMAVGKMKDRAAAELVRRYEARLPRGVKIEWIETPAASGKGDRSVGRSREAAALRAKLPVRAYVAALSESGREMNSGEFAAWIKKIRDEGRDLCFLIGGPDGLDPSLLRQAHEVLALSRLTFPHELCRAILAEQLYRGFSILQGEPYHRS